MKCRECKKIIKNAHKNQIMCTKCSQHLRKFPKTTLTKKQIDLAKSLIGKKTRIEISDKVGCSLSNLKRALRGTRIVNLREYSDHDVRRVCLFYNNNSLPDTQKMFPTLNVGVIVESKKAKKYLIPKCKKWEDSDFYELAKMSGIISYPDQARYFSRPRAGAGSIKSVWSKRFKILSVYSINGIKKHKIKEFLSDDFKYLKVKTKNGGSSFINLALYCDVEDAMIEETPDFLKKAIRSLAMYQRWLHKAKNNKECKTKIIKMINERQI